MAKNNTQTNSYEMSHSQPLDTVPKMTNIIDQLTNDRSSYIFIYSILIVIVLYLVFQRALALYLFCLTASRRIHEKLLNSVIQAKMYFFNTNSSGRIVNRFSKDLYDVDYYLALVLYDLTLVCENNIFFFSYLEFKTDKSQTCHLIFYFQ